MSGELSATTSATVSACGAAAVSVTRQPFVPSAHGRTRGVTHDPSADVFASAL